MADKMITKVKEGGSKNNEIPLGVEAQYVKLDQEDGKSGAYGDNASHRENHTNLQDKIIQLNKSIRLDEHSGNASGAYSTAFGKNTKATGDNAHSEGESTIAKGVASHAEGKETIADEYMGAHAEGFKSQALNASTHAEGYNTKAKGDCSHAEGNITVAEGDSSHAEGANTTAGASCAHAEGNSTTASGEDSHAEGFHTIASGNHSHAEGQGTIAEGSCSHTEGYSTVAKSTNSHAEGQETEANANSSHVEGYKTRTGSSEPLINTIPPVKNIASHAEGIGTCANNKAAHAEGIFTIADGMGSHAEGVNTIAIGDGSHAEGLDNYETGPAGHVEGQGHLVQDGLLEIPSYAIKVVPDTPYYDENGYKMTSFEKTPVNLQGLPVENIETYRYLVSGFIASLPEELNYDDIKNKYIKAKHSLSGFPMYGDVEVIVFFAGNARFIALAQTDFYLGPDFPRYDTFTFLHQLKLGATLLEPGHHVQGRYSILKSSYAHVVGGGSSDSDRKNIHNLDWSGNAEFAGDVIAYGCNGKNPIKLSSLRELGSGSLVVREEDDFTHAYYIGNEILRAIKAGRQILIELVNKGQNNTHRLYSPVITYHLPKDKDSKLSLFYLPDQANISDGLSSLFAEIQIPITETLFPN